MPLPALLAAGFLGLVLGVVGSDAAAKEETEKERKRFEEKAEKERARLEEEKAAWLEIARERERLEEERRNMRAAFGSRSEYNDEDEQKTFGGSGLLDNGEETFTDEEKEDDGEDCGKSGGTVSYVLSRRDGESEEEHAARICALYAIGAYIGYFAPESDIDEEMLGEPERSELIEDLKSGLAFDAIKEKYLDGFGSDELRELDGIVRRMIFVEGESSEHAYDFYAYKWKPYLDARLKG